MSTGESSAEYQSLVAALEADKDAYIEAVHCAANIAHEYAGTEAEYDALIAALDTVESFAKKHVLVLPGAGIVEKEEYLAEKWKFTEVPLTVSDFLVASSDSLDQAIEQKISQILWRKTIKTILPSGDGELKPDQGQGAEYVEPRFEPRLKELVMILQEIGVFTDDIIITTGENSPTMMRKESYMIVEIPRLTRTVLVCDQVGEATFVIDGYFSENTLTALSKDELVKTHGDKVHRIERHSYDNWKEKILLYLLPQDQENQQVVPKKSSRERKVLVVDYLAMRDRIQADLSPEKLISMKVRGLDIDGLKMTALCTLLGVKVDVIDRRYTLLKLGEAVWGADNPVIKKAIEIHNRTPEDWKIAFKKKYPFVEKVIRFDASEIRGLDVDGYKIRALCRVLKVSDESNPQNTLTFLKLCEAVWGADNPVIKKAIEIHNRTPEDWKIAFKKKYPFPEQVVNFGRTEIRNLEVDGYKITALCGVLKVPDECGAKSTLDLLKLCEAVWGADCEPIKNALAMYDGKKRKK